MRGICYTFVGAQTLINPNRGVLLEKKCNKIKLKVTITKINDLSTVTK